MKINAGTVLVLVAALALTACAATEPRSAGTRFHLADSYMQAVERSARNKGIDVVWINAPGRAPAKKNASEDD